MKYQFCPTCDKKLGIPEKRWAYPVTCPQCTKVFLPTSQYEVSGRQEKTSSEPSAAQPKTSDSVSNKSPASPTRNAPSHPPANPPRPVKPSMRAMPLPAALKQKQSAADAAPTPTPASPVETTKPSKTASIPAAKPNPLNPPTVPAAENSAPAAPTSVPAAQTVPPPSQSPRRASRFRVADEDATEQPTANAPRAVAEAPRAGSPMSPLSQLSPPTAAPALQTIPATPPPAAVSHIDQPAPTSATHESGTVIVPEKKAVARIIRTHDVEVPLSRDGKLPRLHLKDEAKVESTSNDIKTSPIVLGALISFSLISSALILLFGDFQSNPDRQSAEKARQLIQNYYKLHEDRPMKPYQLELRAAQLAHSKGDRKSEIAAYRNVMARFRAEDRNQFVGLTGSPTADIELQELISILLRDAEGR